MTPNTKNEKFRHNKKRNVAICYELLVRRMASNLLENNQSKAQKTFAIIEKYFKPKSVLALELELFNAISASRNIHRNVARKIVSEVLFEVKKIDEVSLNKRKSSLLKEINYTFGKDFFSSYKLPEYRLLASIQMLFDHSRSSSNLTENVYRYKLEESIVNFMVNSSNEVISEKLSWVNSSLVYSVAKSKFVNKYKETLSGSQKLILDKFSTALMSKQKHLINEFIVSEKAKIVTQLRCAKNLKEFKEDKNMQNQLLEAINNLSVGEFTAEESIEEILLYNKLIEEIKSDE